MSDTPETDDWERDLAGPIDPTRPHSARIWNFWLGGKDNYKVDRQAADDAAEMIPGIREAALADRAFLGRAVRHMAGQGVRQFLDIGTGLPTVDNTHEVAQRIDPSCRIVYVDNDPLVLAHARALLTSTPEGRTAYIDADLRNPGTILQAAADTLDFSRPVGLMLLGILHHLPHEDAQAAAERLTAALAPGSYLAVACATDQVHGRDAMQAAMNLVIERGGTWIRPCTPKQISDYCAGLKLLEPGVVSCSRWRPEATPWGQPAEVSQYCAVAHKAGSPR